MIIVMAPNSTQADLDNVISKVKSQGLDVHLSQGTSRTIVGVIGDKAAIGQLEMQHLSGVEKTVRITEKYKLVSREFKRNNTVINVGGVEIGGSKPIVMAGPCAVESMEQLMESATAVAKAGAQFLRGGAFKPRTSPYDFQGLAEQGLKMLREAADANGLKVVTEVVDQRSIETVASYADVLQIGARNMQNFQLLKEVGRAGKPVMLKRGLCATIKELSHLPIVVDPSHGTGRRSMVRPMAIAAIAAGADGLIIEVHPHPEVALSDGEQSLTPADFEEVMADIKRVASLLRGED